MVLALIERASKSCLTISRSPLTCLWTSQRAGFTGRTGESKFPAHVSPYLLLMNRSIPLGNTVNRSTIPKKGEKTKHEILVRKLHEGIGLELDVKNRSMYITDLLGGVYRADLDGSNKKVLIPDLGTVTGIAIAHL